MVAATSVALALTANQATVGFDAFVSATKQSLVLTEYQAGINEFNISATTDALVLTANRAILDADINAAVHDLGLSEFQATISLISPSSWTDISDQTTTWTKVSPG